MLCGYTMMDEYVIGCLIFGIFIRSSLSAGKPQDVSESNLERLHQFVFSLLVIYMVFQCFRGILVLESLRKIRWVIFYLMLGILAPLLVRSKNTIPSVRKMSFLVVIVTLIYFSFYIGYGLFFELLGINRFNLQYSMVATGINVGKIAIWGSSAYNMFPLVIAMPAIFIILKDRDRVFRWVGWVTLVVLFCASFYYESRVSMLAITAFIIVSLTSLGLRKWLITIFICVLVFTSFFSFVWKGDRDIDYFLEEVYGVGSRLLEAGRSGAPGKDIDRYIWTKVAFISINDNWHHFLFGHGFRTSGYIVAPYVYDLFRIYNRPQAYYEDVSTEAFTNLVVDTGMVGLLLLLINFVLVASQILIKKANPDRSVLLLSLFILFAWLFVVNIIDVILFYLAIMPSGLLVQLSRNESLPFGDSRRASHV